ncbi:MAG: PAS domain S-box protein [Desulfobacterales bacterium]|jgi:PAS domain S-box-containing protein
MSELATREDQKERVKALEQSESNRKQTEEHLKLFKKVLENATDAIGISTPEGRHWYQNAAFDALFGDIGVDPPATLYCDINVGREVFETIMAGGEWSGEVQMYAADGRVLDILLRAYAFTDETGLVLGLVGIHTDITTSKRSQELFKLVAQSTNDVFYEWNVQTDSLQWFSDIAAELGYAPGEVPPTINGWIEIIHPEDRPQLADAVEKHRIGTHDINYHYRVKHKNGTWRYWHDHATPVLDSQNRPVRWVGGISDITEHKQAEIELLREKNFSETLISQLPGSYYMFAENGRMLRWNDNFEKVTGYSAEDIQQMNALDFFDDDEKDIVHRRIKEVFVTGVSQVDTNFLTKDGRKIPHVLTGARVEYDGVAYLLGVGLDITKNKQVEDAYKESEARFRQIAENIREVFWLFDWQEQRVLYVSPAYDLIWGRSRESLYERYDDWGESIHPNDVKHAQETFNRILDTGGGEPREYRIVRPDGSERWISDTGYAVKDGNGKIVRITGIAEDITERKKAEEALATKASLESIISKASQRFQTLSELDKSINACLADIGHFCAAGRAYVFQFTSGGATMNNTHEWCAPGVKPEIENLQGLPLDMFPWWMRLLEAGENIHVNNVAELPSEARAEKEILEAQNIKSVLIVPFLVENRLAGFLGFDNVASTRAWGDKELVPLRTLAEIIGAAVTRKQAEEALRENEGKLARSKKMESLGLLAGGVAHDLNNVLSGIVSYPELILMDIPQNSKLRGPIETIQESGNRAVAIVQDLLTVARGVAITTEPLNLNELISDYLNSPEFKRLEQFHPTVTFKTHLDAELLNINGSHVHIRKVVMNLMSNGSEAIEGSGTVTISTMNRFIDKPLRGYDKVNIGEYVVLSVSDDGSGVPLDDLERIFEPFYTKKVMGRSGTGLGLAVVWNVVQDHKGYVDVTSNENGTIFELYFPIIRAEISDKAMSLPINDYKGNGEIILVVDDVKSQREISCMMLDTLGYKTKAVRSGEEAIEYLKENTVDLLLLDMIMDPGINGRETYERIIESHPKQKAIIVSGFAETEDVKEAQKLGTGKYIKKPLTLERIGMTVKEELEKR